MFKEMARVEVGLRACRVSVPWHSKIGGVGRRKGVGSGKDDAIYLARETIM
jgi:hypothetical protein